MPALRALIRALDGTPPDPADWLAVIEVANHSWLTPAVFLALERSGALPGQPSEIRDYLGFIHGRNRQRNLCLRAQLIEAIGALNRAGIRPMVLKGAGILLLAPDADIGARMMSDLDLLIADTEKPAADAALGALGYQASQGLHGLWRPADAGVLELHCLNDALDAYGAAIIAAARCSSVERDRIQAWLPSPTFRAAHLIMHDQIKEGDYWRGSIDLRHLRDLAALAEGIDWDMLKASLSAAGWWNAAETQLLTLRDLFGVQLPAELTGRLVPRLQHWRRMAQIRHPVLAAPLRLAGAMAWLARRIRLGDRPSFTLADFAPRIARKLLQGRRRTIEALMGVHLGPKL